MLCLYLNEENYQKLKLIIISLPNVYKKIVHAHFFLKNELLIIIKNY